MWPSFTSSFSNKEKMQAKVQPTRNLNINDEYLCAVRTKSFVDFFVQAQLLVNEQNPTHCHPEILLNPDQETTTSVLESSILSKKASHQKLLLSNYFNISAEASNLCRHLMRSLNQLQTNYNPKDEEGCHSWGLAEGFEVMSRQDFRRAQERHSWVLQQLRRKRRRTKRKIKEASSTGAAAMFLALMGPAALPRMRRLRLLKVEVEQLDVAAKGAYILKRDFDTMGRLVERIEAEVEHSRAMMERRWREDRHCLQVLKEVNKSEFGARKQAEELQEHLYLCLVTINRARAMLLREICRTT